jgi:hypothetical protein
MKEATTSPAQSVAETRKAYRKPEVEQVRLALEEAVLATGCKTTFSADEGYSLCATAITPQCFEKGS